MITRDYDGIYSTYTKPSRITHKEVLSTGQILTVRFQRTRYNGPPLINDRMRFIWFVYVHIGDTRKCAGRWNQGKKDITGKSGIEGLRRAAQIVLNFGSICDFRDEMRIVAIDKRRARAYRRMLRHPGFLEAAPDELHYRNPAYYEYTGEKP